MAAPILLFVAIVTSFFVNQVHCRLSITTSETAFYTVSVNGTQWIRGSQAFFYANGDIYTTEGWLGALGNLTLRNTETVSDKDELGVFEKITYHYFAGFKPIQLYIKSYTKDGLDVIIFGQKYLEDTHGTTAREGSTIGGFPNFGFFFPLAAKVAYLSLGGNWLGDEEKKVTEYHPETGMNITNGFLGGPLTMFDPTGNTLIISPFNHFMAASMFINQDNFFQDYVHWGLMGTLDFVPAGTEYQTIMYYGKGINQAFEGWGNLMRNYYKKTDLRSTDITLQNVGYWTDEGTAYYEGPEDGENYENTILDIKTNMDEKMIPFKYLQLDDWFYEKDENGGTVSWEARNDTIPDGLTFLHEKTGLPVVLQNGFWSNSTPYAVDNGGNFTFLISGEYAVPLGEDFWDFLFSRAKEWGLTVYQQDWMMEQTLSIPDFQTNLTLGRDWLMAMGRSAERHGITIQYSGALPRHALQSLEIPAVTQARVSTDYGLSPDQWKIGITSLFAYALGLAPFKDAYLSTRNTTNNETSMMPELQSVVATLSKGPVGSGDAINDSNPTVASRNCCDMEGRILGPSKPATTIQKQIMEMAYNNSMGPKGEVWTTYSDISGYRFGIIFSRLISGHNFTGTGSDFFGPDFPESKLYTLLVTGQTLDFTPSSKLFLCCNDVYPFYTTFYTAPVFSIGPQKAEVVVLGEMWKHVPMSPDRVLNITVTTDEVHVLIRGVPQETITFWYAVYDKWTNVQFSVDKTGQKLITIKAPPPTTPTTTTMKPISSTHSGSGAMSPHLTSLVLCILGCIMRLLCL